MKTFLKGIVAMMLVFGLTGCVSNIHQADNSSVKSQELTVGVVQKEIKVGMSQSDVATILGSPNIVTKDKSNMETWIYDKISSTVSYKKNSSYGTLILLGASTKSGIESSTQKTLTIIIKFKQGVVDGFTYHSSSF